LRNNIENPANTILIVGYQAENTLGRKILERQPAVKIFGENYSLRAQVEVIDAFSGHADRSDLIDHLSAINTKPKQIFLVHGEEGQGLTFADILRESDFPAVTVAEMGAVYQF
jgi:metallo-beta-lactamase family protein